MLTIRAEQFAVFSQVAVESFEEWMVRHLNHCFPRRSAIAGDAAIRRMIRSGVKRAATHGMTARRNVCKYIDLMMVFGNGFDTDEGLPWARSILAGPGDSAERMRALHHAARQRLEGR